MMARGIEGNEISTPKPNPPKKTNTSQKSTQGQRSILGFFNKKPASQAAPATSNASPTLPSLKNVSSSRSTASLTPAPSSDPVVPSSPTKSSQEALATLIEAESSSKDKENRLPSPISPTEPEADKALGKVGVGLAQGSPSRKVKKTINYAESSEDEEEVFRPTSGNGVNSRPSKRRKIVSDDDSEDEYGSDAAALEALADDEDDMDAFIAPDDSDEDVVKPQKRKRVTSAKTSKKSPSLTPTPHMPSEEAGDIEMPTVSTAQQWNFDPDNVEPGSSRPVPSRKPPTGKQKAHATEPEKRYTWLANILDADRNPPDHPDYDPRTIFVPPLAWAKFSPFERQYWEIKQKFWDTIVFFKKGKFYELYEKDATIGHQLFDLKLTDRVNMRMVGVPEASLDHWANQFVAKGYKIARVDQMESALGKEMRERDDKKPKKEEKVIRRELASVLTGGTLVDGGMLQDDMSTFCVAIKEQEIDNEPAFGVAFVDAATAQFHIAQWTDDPDLTKFETFIAQTRPGEILLEKSCVSTKAMRILKNNTGLTTIWNYLKPEKEFWAADITCRELDASDYFVNPQGDNLEAWPKILRESRDKKLLMSAFGALTQYLRTLKIERELITLGNFSWYDPIRKATSLVLDGQSLINLEVFANSFDGSQDGTLFAMLNRCVTPFGKRMLRQWVCHPLADSKRINARLDAVEALMADSTVEDRFTSSLSKLPDLERLLSRVHAGRCKVIDFVKVLEGFEQIEYTMSILGSFGEGEGVLGQLLKSMPNLADLLKYWKDAFDREKAKSHGVLIPQPGVESDFDESQEEIDRVMSGLEKYLKEQRRSLGSNAIAYRDVGKEIYQLEIPGAVKNVPKNWDQMSATKAVKRYYSSDLRRLVRQLQEGQETHGQIAKEVAARFYARFDEHYTTWLAAVKIIAQLDCLISLARASSSMGQPSCRPEFIDDANARTALEFEELRHPCMVQTVPDFIANDIKLGGDAPNIDLLTGANAAGKSTVLRMTCIAVILAQLGVYLPCQRARLTPIDRIMSRLGAHDAIFAAQSTFFVELAETKKILSEATPRSLVILDELGRGTSSYDGVAVAEAVLHHLATWQGCVGVFATHYHSLAVEFANHPEIRPKRMAIDVDEEQKRVTFLYKLEKGVAEGSFGMHCAAMCGIPSKVIANAEVAAKEWEHTSRLKEKIEENRVGVYVPLGLQSDVAQLLRSHEHEEQSDLSLHERGLEVLRMAIEAL